MVSGTRNTTWHNCLVNWLVKNEKLARKDISRRICKMNQYSLLIPAVHTDHVAFIKVERTKDRPIACGEITRLKAFVFLGLPLSASLAILLLLNWNTSVFCIVLSLFFIFLRSAKFLSSS